LRLATILLASAAAGLMAGAPPPVAAPTGEQLFRQAQKAEHDGEIIQAYLLYAEAAAADPTKIEYWSRAQALRPAASLLEASPPKPPDFPSDKIDRTLFGTVTNAELEEARKPLPPEQLQAEPGRRDYDFQGDSKALWEQVAAALHLKVLFDADYKPTRAFRFDLSNADYREALRGLQAATDSFLVPVSPRLIFVANDTTQKRKDFERTAAIVVPFPESISVQELQELATAIRGALDSQKLMVDNSRHLILIRDKVAKVRMAQKLLADLLRPRAQVTIDVEILTTDLSSSLSYGLSLPTSFGLSSFLNRSNLTNAVSYLSSSYSTFLAFGGGASMLGLGITSAQLFA
jgi:general secretion pathway protein D